MASLMPLARQRFWNNDGTLAAGCKLYLFEAGTNTPKVVYRDSLGTDPHPHPIVLDAKGEVTMYGAGAYKMDLTTAAGVQITGFPVDNVVVPASSSDLAAGTGAGLLGFNYALAYGVGTLGRWLKDLALGTGSTFMGFVAAGVGAVTRTVREKLRERISVADYGATEDGITDDTAAVQLALDAAQGKTLDFTPGSTLRCNSTLIVKGDGTKIRGNGVTINSYAAVNGLTFELVGGTRYPVNINIEDFSLNAYGVGAFGMRILTSYSTYRRISVGLPAVNVSGRGIVLVGDEANGTGPYYNTFDCPDVQSGSFGLDHIGISFMSVAPSFNRGPNSNTFIGPRVGSCFQNFNIKGDGNTIINPIAESPLGVGTAFTFEATTATNCAQNTIIGGRMESPSVGFHFTANARNNICMGTFGTGVTTWKNDLGVGNQVHTAIGAWAMPTGINFPTLSADTSALDYYGEGAYTPVPTNITVNSGAPVWSGTWTRVGNTVRVNIKMTGGNVTINAATSKVTLPFNASQVEWGTFGNNITTAFGGGVATYTGDLFFTSALTASGVGATVSYGV